MRDVLTQLSGRLLKSAVAWNYFSIALRVGVAPLVIILFAKRMTEEEAGLWYLFNAIAAMGVVLDLGFALSLSRAVSSFWCGATSLKRFGLEVSGAASVDLQPNYPGLGALIHTMKTYYRCIGGALCLLLLTFGSWLIWRKTRMSDHALSLRLSWIVFVFGASLNTMGSFWPSVLTGIGAVRQAQQAFVMGLVVNYLLTIGMIISGFGVWAFVVGNVLMGVIMIAFSRRVFYRLVNQELLRKTCFDKNLLVVLWPISWRSGLLQCGNYLILTAPFLVMQKFYPVAESASYGFTMQMTMLVVQFSTPWVQTKIPYIIQLRIQSEHKQILSIVIPRMRMFCLVYCLASAGLLMLGPSMLSLISSRLHLLPAPQLGLMLFFLFLQAHHTMYEQLVLSENENPFSLPYLVSGLVAICLVVILVPRIGVLGLILGPLAAQLAFDHWYPVRRALRGLGISSSEYFSAFFLKWRA